MKQIIVGTYEIGFEQCQLVLREGTGGEFYCIPEKGSLPRIKVGADDKKWDECVSVLLHETLEFVLNRLQRRYSATDYLGRDHAGYLFVMTHEHFTDACAKAGEFITAALPDLSRAWKKWRKPKRRKRKKPS